MDMLELGNMDWAYGRFHINLWLKRGRVEVRNPQSLAYSPLPSLPRPLAAGGTPIYTRDLHVLCSVVELDLTRSGTP